MKFGLQAVEFCWSGSDDEVELKDEVENEVEVKDEVKVED